MMKLIEERVSVLNEAAEILYGYDQLEDYLRSIGEYFTCSIGTNYSGWFLKKGGKKELTADELISILEDEYGTINRFSADGDTVSAKKRINNPDYGKYPDEPRTETHNIFIKKI